MNMCSGDAGTDFHKTRPVVNCKALKKWLLGNLYFMNLENRSQTVVWTVRGFPVQFIFYPEKFRPVCSYFIIMIYTRVGN